LFIQSDKTLGELKGKAMKQKLKKLKMLVNELKASRESNEFRSNEN